MLAHLLFSSHSSAREVLNASAKAVTRAFRHSATYIAKAVGHANKDIKSQRNWQYNRLVELFNNKNV